MLESIDNTTFERIALTPEQITEYHLLPDPELSTPKSKAFEKLHKDSRVKAFKKESGILTQYEVNSLHGSAPEAFKRIVLQAVDRYFEDIYNEVLEQEEHSIESLNKLLRKKIKNLTSSNKK